MYDAADGVPEERTGFRDDDLKEFHERYGITGITPKYDVQMSQWHRGLGAGCSATDIDFLLIEHRYGEPAAIFEYKRQSPQKININTNYNALMRLCNKAEIPLFVIFYNEHKTWFWVTPLGRTATELYGPEQRKLEKAKFVEFSYELRDTEVPPEIIDKLMEQ